MEMTERIEVEAASSNYDFSDLKALFINCTLKPSPNLSHTEGLMDISRRIMEKPRAVSMETISPSGASAPSGPRR